ncbi:MAG: ABC transporter ATP-binding protein, partial [Candidatus Methanoperedens sp.]|nr:ABC transporter ATP-binding protein [Candidatus Methanoperedens sp.]
TYMNMIGMLDTPTSGSIYIDGNDVTKMNSSARAEYRLKHIGFIFQFFNLFMELTALENVMFPMMLNKQSGHKEKAKGLLNLVGLGDRLHHLPSELSGGQQQRVTIARSLANSPKILLADEPTGNLDTRSSIEIIELFRKLNKERGQTILMVTHSLEIGEKADRIIHFRDGKVEVE